MSLKSILIGPTQFWTLWAVRFLLIWELIHFIPFLNFVPALVWRLGGMYVLGLIPHALTIGLLADLKANKIPRKLIILPLIIYGAYYAAYCYQAITINSLEEHYKTTNPAHILSFDSDKYSLVLNHVNGKNKISLIDYAIDRIPLKYATRPDDASSFISQSKLPVVYKEDKRKGGVFSISFIIGSAMLSSNYGVISAEEKLCEYAASNRSSRMVLHRRYMFVPFS